VGGTELVEKPGDYSFPRKVFYADGLLLLFCQVVKGCCFFIGVSFLCGLY